MSAPLPGSLRASLTEIAIAGRQSSEFDYDFTSYRDDALKSAFRGCSSTCHHYEGQAPAYHAECLAFASWVPSSAFLDAIKYSFEPMQSEDRRRHERTRHILGNRLQQEHRTLPTELWFLIAEHLVRECAIGTFHELWRTRLARIATSIFNSGCGLITSALTASVMLPSCRIRSDLSPTSLTSAGRQRSMFSMCWKTTWASGS